MRIKSNDSSKQNRLTKAPHSDAKGGKGANSENIIIFVFRE